MPAIAGPLDDLSNHAFDGNSRATESGTAGEARAERAAKGALRFTSLILFASLFLQRFAVPLGAKPFSFVGPVGLLLAAIGIWQGVLVIHRRRLFAYLALAFFVLLALMAQVMRPAGTLDGPPNLSSMFQFLLLTTFATLSFGEPLDERRFFRTVNFWFIVIALFGLGEFFAQFAGIRIFKFTGFLPGAILYEYGYNTQIAVGVGGLFKSNGFFLVEPSVFSQVMALGLIIEILNFRRPAILALFALSLLLSFSGTGWIVLTGFVIAAVVGMGQRGIAMAGCLLLVLGLALGILSYAAPQFTGALEQRSDEFSTPGTSAHRRFITPFWALSDTLADQPSAIVVGLGSGVSERLRVPYDYDVNTPIKVMLDEGLPALIAYFLLFVLGRKTAAQAALVAPAIVLFFVTGSYQQFPPVLFLVFLLISVARLKPNPARSAG